MAKASICFPVSYICQTRYTVRSITLPLLSNDSGDEDHVRRINTVTAGMTLIEFMKHLSEFKLQTFLTTTFTRLIFAFLNAPLSPWSFLLPLS
jgi:hypothetical protein